MDALMFWKVVGVALYLSVLLGIGVVASRRTKDLRDYYAADKGLGFWAVAFSARATGAASISATASQFRQIRKAGRWAERASSPGQAQATKAFRRSSLWAKPCSVRNSSAR